MTSPRRNWGSTVRIDGTSALVTGGASGLGLATSLELVSRGAHVVIADLLGSPGGQIAAELGPLADFAPTDVTDSDQFEAALDRANANGPLRVLVHCAGRGGPARILDRDGVPAPLDLFKEIMSTNLVGTFNALRLAAARMAKHEPSETGERGVCVLTASVAAFEGQIGQICYTASKAGVVGMTLCAARDLASHHIRVCTVAPGVIDTPKLAKGRPHVREALAAAVPYPKRLGRTDEFATLVCHILQNGYLNGETIRLDGAIRMAPK
jgi:NAD(P)-dependent dehydrogenase (short-subunit alcohol dehydrogenase family)